MNKLALAALLWAGCFDTSSLSSKQKNVPGDMARAVLDGAISVDGAAAPADGATAPADGAAFGDGAVAPDMACTQYTHSNGLGQTWTDCVPLGTYNDTQAKKACIASFPSGPCIDPASGAECAGKGVAYTNSPGGWTVFVYTGGLVGKVIQPGGDCTVPGTTTDWN